MYAFCAYGKQMTFICDTTTASSRTDYSNVISVHYWQNDTAGEAFVDETQIRGIFTSHSSFLQWLRPDGTRTCLQLISTDIPAT